MANIKSSLKDIRRTTRRTEHNRQIRSKLKTLAKKAREAHQSADPAEAEASVRAYLSALDKAAKTGIVHRNKASRHKAALSRPVAQAE